MGIGFYLSNLNLYCLIVNQMGFLVMGMDDYVECLRSIDS